MITLDQAKARLNVPLSNTSNDMELQSFVDAATEAVEQIRGETMDPRDFTEEHVARGGVLVLNHVPVLSLTSVASVDGSTVWDVSQLHPHLATGEVFSTVSPMLAGRVSVTYQAGYTSVPKRYVEAALIIVQQLNRTQRGVGSVRAGESDMTTMTGIGFAIPNAALELLGGSLPGIA